MKIDPLTRKQFEVDGFLVLDEIITKDLISNKAPQAFGSGPSSR